MVKHPVALTALLALGGVSSSSGADSITQIRDTLRTLLGSVQSEGKDAEFSLQQTQQWCDSTLFDLKSRSRAANAQLAEMQLDQKEGEAAAEEAEGSVQQIRADITLVQHTINQTEEMRKVWLHEENVERKSAELAQKDAHSDDLSSKLNTALLQSKQAMEKQFKSDHRSIGELIENKKQTLNSLEGELEVVLLAHAQMQARAAEMKRRITDRGESSAVEDRFTSALRSDCDHRGLRASARTEARNKAATAIEQAVDALQRVGAQPLQELAAADVAESSAPADDDDDGPESFLQEGQQSQISAEDVLALLGGGPAQPPRPANAQDGQVLLQRPRERKVLALSQGRIGQLLTQVKSTSSSASELKRWCSREREQNKLATRLAQDLVGQISAEIDAHNDAEAQLSEALAGLDEYHGLLNSTMKQIADAAKREVTLITKGEKDRELAGKILDQATKILDNLQEKGQLAKAGVSGDVVRLLKNAKSAVAEHADTSQSLQQEAVDRAKNVIKQAHAVGVVQDRERANAEELRDEHVSERGSFTETKHAYEAEVTQANAYLAKLNEECSAAGLAHQKQQRETQVHALEDAKKVLEGKRVLSRDDAYGLRGATSSSASKSTKNLSPLEKAAMEIGVAVVEDK